MNGLALSMALLVIAPFTVTGSASTKSKSTPSATLRALNHKSFRATYAYTCCSSRLVNTIYHPGGLLVIHWIRYVDTSPPHERILIDATLIGPFHSVSDLTQELIHSGRVAGATMVHAVSITVDNSVPKILKSVIRIPKTAKPGFYDLQTGDIDLHTGNSGSGVSVIQVAG
jgi:hypothetical protein